MTGGKDYRVNNNLSDNDWGHAVQTLNAAFDRGDTDQVMITLTGMARARGISTVARETGLGRESLYKSMRPTSRPSFVTVLKVMHALGLGLRTFSNPTASPPSSREKNDPEFDELGVMAS